MRKVSHRTASIHLAGISKAVSEYSTKITTIIERRFMNARFFQFRVLHSHLSDKEGMDSN